MARPAAAVGRGDQPPPRALPGAGGAVLPGRQGLPGGGAVARMPGGDGVGPAAPTAPTALVSRHVGQQPPAIDLDQLWADLASKDEARATRAAELLAASPKDSVPYLQQRVQPVKVDPERVAQWIRDLDSDKFRVRQKATEELEYLGKFAEDAMKKALAGRPTVEVTM